MKNLFSDVKNQVARLNQNTVPLIFICIVFIVLPLVSSSLTIDPETLPRFIIIVTLLLACSVYFIKISASLKPQYNFQNYLKQPLILCTLFYVSSALIALINSQNYGDGFFDFLKIIIPVILASYLALFLRKSEAVFNYCVLAISLSAILFNSCVVFQILDLIRSSPENIPHLRTGYYVSSTLGNKDVYCEVLFLSLPFSFYGVFYSHKWQKFVSGIAFLSSIAALTVFITIYIYVAAAICLITSIGLIFILRKSFGINTQKYLTSILVTLLISVAVISFFTVIKQKNTDKGYSITHKINLLKHYLSGAENKEQNNIAKDNNNVHERIALIKNATAMIRQKPISGFGLANWKIYTPQYGSVSFSAFTRLQNPHNDFLWIWAEMGLSGILSYLALLFFLLRATMKIIIKTTTGREKLLGLLLFNGILGFAIISFFSYPKERIFPMILLATYSAIIITRLPQINLPAKGVSSRLLVFTTLILLLGLTTGLARLNGEIHLQRAIKYQLQNRWVEMEEQTKAAESFFYQMDGFATPVAWYQGLACYYSGNTGRAMELFLEAENINPFHLQVLSDIGACYEQQGNHDKAILYFNRAFKIFPISTLQNLVAATFNSGQTNKAYDLVYENGLQNNKDFLYQVILPVASKLTENLNDNILKQKLNNLIFNKDSLIESFNMARMSKTKLETVLLNKTGK